jgi:hypothetical protein
LEEAGLSEERMGRERSGRKGGKKERENARKVNPFSTLCVVRNE